MRILAATAVAGLLSITPCLAQGVRTDALPAKAGADGATRLGGSNSGSSPKTYNLGNATTSASQGNQPTASKTRAPRNAPMSKFQYDISQGNKPPQLGPEFHDGITGIGRGVGMMLFGEPKGKPKPQRLGTQAPSAQPGGAEVMGIVGPMLLQGAIGAIGSRGGAVRGGGKGMGCNSPNGIAWWCM